MEKKGDRRADPRLCSLASFQTLLQRLDVSVVQLRNKVGIVLRTENNEIEPTDSPLSIYRQTDLQEIVDGLQELSLRQWADLVFRF